MPIYRGGQKVTPVRGSQPVSRVYRGSSLVWQAGKAVTPAELGAIHWLPFISDPLEDLGTEPVVWLDSWGNATIEDGAIVRGSIEIDKYETTYNPLAGASISAWVYPVAGDDGAFPIMLEAAAQNYSLSFTFRQDTRAISWRYRSGAANARWISAGTLPTGWSHVALAMEPVSGTTWRYRGYLNGAEIVNETYDAGAQGAANYPDPKVQPSISRQWFDDFAVYNHPISAADAAALYESGRTN